MPLARFFPRLVRRSRQLPAPVRYAGGAAITVGLFGLRHTLLTDLLPSGPGYLMFVLAVLLAGSLFGVGAGVFATLLAAGLAAYYMLPPVGSLAVHDTQHLFALLLFMTVSGFMTTTLGAYQGLVARLEASEQHRALLLREFRHRTRNDLQSLVGLLLLRARGAATEGARDGLKEAAQHAMALARVHTRLASASPGDGEEAVVDSREFILGLVNDLVASQSGNGIRPIAIVAEAESHPLNTERCVQVGLVLNEVVTNALKYGYPGEDQDGTVKIYFRAEEGEFVLEVRDDGVGIPTQAPPSNRGTGLGTRLLRALAAQLRGSFTRTAGPSGRGVVAILRFPMRGPTMLPMPKGA